MDIKEKPKDPSMLLTSSLGYRVLWGFLVAGLLTFLFDGKVHLVL